MDLQHLMNVELGVRPYQFEPEADSDEEFVHQAPEPNEDERLENTNWFRQWLEIVCLIINRPKYYKFFNKHVLLAVLSSLPNLFIFLLNAESDRPFKGPIVLVSSESNFDNINIMHRKILVNKK
jgi:hypothetical protein